MVQVKQGIKSPFVKTSRQLTVWKKAFKDAEKTAVTRKEPRKRRMILFKAQTLTETRNPRDGYVYNEPPK